MGLAMTKGAKIAAIAGFSVLFFLFVLVPGLIVAFIVVNPGGLASPWRTALGL